MEKLTKILKRELHRMPRLVIAFVGLVVTLIASVVAFPLYLFSFIGKDKNLKLKPNKSIDSQVEL